MKRRRVQAQRKFAHGAYVPNSNCAVPERKVTDHNNSQSREDQRNNVIHNNMTARNLLDVVSLKNIHRHREPIVVLERLQPSSSAGCNLKNINFESVTSQLITSLKQSTKKKKVKPVQEGMCLRSKLITKAKLKRSPRVTRKNPKIVRKVVESLSKTKILRNRKTKTKEPENEKVTDKHICVVTDQNSLAEFSLDDEKPLMFFANTVLADAIPENYVMSISSSDTKTGTIPPLSDIQACLDDIVLEDLTVQIPCTESFETNVENIASTSNEFTNNEVQKDVMVYLGNGYYGTNGIHRWLSNSMPSASDLAVNDSTFKTPHPPLKRQRGPGDSTNSTPMWSETSEPTDVCIEPIQSTGEDPSTHVQQSEVMEATQITLPKSCVSMVTKSIKSSSSTKLTCRLEPIVPPLPVITTQQDTVKDSKKTNEHAHPIIPTLPTSTSHVNSPILPSGSAQETITLNPSAEQRQLLAPTSCPSVNLVTIEDIIRAPHQEVERFCNQCEHCKRVHKVAQLSSALQGPSEFANSINGDVYDIDNTSDILENCASTTSSAYDELENNGEPVYLDLLHKSSKFVIMVVTETLPNQDKKLLRARLVSKSEATTSRNFSVASLEKLLDGILKKVALTIANNSKNKNHINKASQPSTSKHKINESPFPPLQRPAKLVEAPIFYPTEHEFLDPISYFEKIMPLAANYGLCKVVAPGGFKPDCNLGDKLKFTVINQYIARLYSRWGPSAREMCAIKAYLATQKVMFTKPPLVEGMEVNLPKLYHIVQDNGGLNNVIEKKRWGKVAEQMRFPKGRNPEKKLDQVYVKFLLPYDTLSSKERQQMTSAVEKCWNKKNQKMLDRAMQPLHRQMRLLGESDSSEDDTEDEGEVAAALNEAEDCVVQGRRMHLGTFKKVASNVMHTHFPDTSKPDTIDIESTYWRLVLLSTDHVCVNTASIDTGDEGYGFTKEDGNSYYSQHPWNLKMLSKNNNNILRSMGPVLGVTVPTLHLGMVFSTSCWHRDPHGLPWIEYMHTGPRKIWYGIPNEQSNNFRKAVETLCPSYCQNKSIWLPSDITMIPPNLLKEHNVSLSRVEQNPGEFIIVFPKAYSCSICTGYTVSESIYFATTFWLNTVHQVFQELRESCEPSMFSLEQLLIAAVRDVRVPLSVLHQISNVLFAIINEETSNRQALIKLGLQTKRRSQPQKKNDETWNTRDHEECDFCRCTLYLSQVVGLTSKNSAMCLQHALRLLEKPKFKNRPKSEFTLYTLFSNEELETIVKDVENRLGMN